MSDWLEDVCVQPWETPPGVGGQALEGRLATSGKRAVGPGSRGRRHRREGAPGESGTGADRGLQMPCCVGEGKEGLDQTAEGPDATPARRSLKGGATRNRWIVLNEGKGARGRDGGGAADTFAEVGGTPRGGLPGRVPTASAVTTPRVARVQ